MAGERRKVKGSQGMGIQLERKVVQDVGEEPLVLYSDVRGPLEKLSFLRRALVMAELAMIAYNDEAEAQRAAQAIGFPEAQLFDNDGRRRIGFATSTTSCSPAAARRPPSGTTSRPMPTR